MGYQGEVRAPMGYCAAMRLIRLDKPLMPCLLVAMGAAQIAVMGCAQSSELGNYGGGIDGASAIDGGLLGTDGATWDGAVADAFVDGAAGADGAAQPDGAAPFEGKAGAPCMGDGDCGGLLCLDGPAGAGRCSFICTPEIPCPDGVCFWPARGTRVGFCVSECVPGSRDDCADGTVCLADPATGQAFCRESCDGVAECPGASECLETGPIGRCRTPSAPIAGACAGDSECGPGPTTCIRERDRGFAGGLCLQFGCGMPLGRCPEGGACVRFERFGEVCLATCGRDSVCREGYACREAAEGDQVCVPSCTLSSECSGGRICDVLSGLCVDS